MASHEVALGLAWLFATLKADSTLLSLATGGVWQGLAPPSTTTPFVIVAYQSGTDMPVFGGGRAASDLMYEAKCVGPSKMMDSIVGAAERIDQLITLVSQQSVTGGVILACFRKQPLSTDELVDGEVWNSTGGLYCLLAKGS